MKTMAVTVVEFTRSLAALDPGARLDPEGYATIRSNEGCVRLRFEALAERRLGGLLALPQARITLELGRVEPARRTAFLRLFDQAFQRGGG